MREHEDYEPPLIGEGYFPPIFPQGDTQTINYTVQLNVQKMSGQTGSKKTT